MNTDNDTLTRPSPVTTDEGDHERFAHYVFRPEGDPRSAEAIVTEARVNGTPVTALCGKVWVPSRDPKRFPVCPECKAIKDEGNARGLRW
jgi:hypothetical protein